jgi:cyclopropane-fatty-acyl-phospholipid synthase
MARVTPKNPDRGSLFDRWSFAPIGRAALRTMLERFEHGSVRVTLPGGDQGTYGSGEPVGDLQIHDERFFRRILLASDLGFAESFMAGEWSTRDLSTLLYLFGHNEHAIGGLQLKAAGIRQQLARLWHRSRANSLRNSRRNIADHYDLGNEMFAAFLDPSMTYSCAEFVDPDDTLETAQLRKLDRVIDSARIGADDHVLEIGCGWGSFARRAVERTGCRVTGITLSAEQKEWAEAEIRRAGMEDHIDIQLVDYRRLVGSFDRIVSIEMIEAVGREHLPEYFRVCERLLRPGGRMLVQAITIDDSIYESYSRRADFIQRYIFPGGHLPSEQVLRRVVSRHTDLEYAHTHHLDDSYEPTLAEWRRRFEAASEQLRKTGMDEAFIRKWIYYFSYCEAGFRLGRLGNVQIVLDNPEALRLAA